MRIKLVVAAALMGCLSMGSFADFAQFGPAVGWMEVSENDAGNQGAYLWGSGWGTPDLQAITTDDQTFELKPNINTYNSEDAYWATGNDGNKWMNALVYREHSLVAGETTATMNYNVSAFDLDSRYSVQAFVKVLDPDGDWATTYSDFADITATAGTVALTIDDAAMVAGDVLQFGFVTAGLNANPATDWGSTTVTIDSMEVVPEPATLGLLGIAGAALVLFRRNFKA